MKHLKLFVALFAMLALGVGNAWGEDVSVTWPNTTALSTTATNVDGDANVTIKVSEANTYTNPLRFYAGKTTTIEVAEGYQLKSVAYEASSTGNYVTYAQDATVSPDVTPSVNGKIITWDLSGSNTKTFTFTPSSQTRCNGITITYTAASGETPGEGGGEDPEEPENPEQPEVITCAQAVEICETTGETSTTETYTIHGYVTSIKTAYSSTHGNISFWMADTKDGGEVLQCYRVVPVKDGEENVKVGDKVEVIGTLVNYNGNTPEVNAGGTYTILEVAAGGETPDPEEPETPGEGGDNVTYVFAEDANNPGNAIDWFTGTIDSYTTWTATKGGSNNPKYYDKGTGLRVYNGGTFSITSTKLIETVTLTFDGTGYTFSTDNTNNPQTVTVNANSYEWSVGRTCRLQKIEIVYGSSDVVIVKTLQSIALSGMTTTYETGDVFNFNGTCTATYAVTKDDVAQEDEQKVVTPTSVSEPDMSTTGEKEVTVTYTEEDVTVIATYTITVNLAEGDKLVLEATGVEGTTYADWSDVQGASGAVYAGNSAGGNNSIQLRKSAEDKPAAGIITTTSGGLIRKVKVGWNINTAEGRTLNVYGKNSAYTAVSELYDNATAGELLGTIVEGTSTELVINGDFEYVGLVSADGALYLDKVVFVWEENEDPDGPTTALDNIEATVTPVKAIVNGQLIIIKNGVQYNAQGQVIK